MRGGKWLLVALGGTELAVLDAVVNDLSPVIGDERSLGDGACCGSGRPAL